MSPTETKTQITTAFNKLLTEYRSAQSKVATKEQEAQKQKNQELLEVVVDYKVNNIVNSMAALQLEFGDSINSISERLTQEANKLEQLKEAIQVENQKLEELQKIRLVADALYILRQEHQEKLKNLETQTTIQTEAIEKEQEQTRKLWEKEQEEFTTRVTEEQQLITKQREKEEADFQYQLQRIRQMESDEYQDAKRQQERQLLDTNQDKEKAWSEREKFLTDNQAEYQANLKKIEGFDEALKKAYNDAKGEAIKDAERESKVKADLIEKEWEATKLGHEFKIQSLEASITRQVEQINEITTQLKESTSQAQNLAMRAFQSPANT